MIPWSIAVSERWTHEHFCQCVGVHMTSSCAKSCACSRFIAHAVSGATSYEHIVIIYFVYWWIIIYRLIYCHRNYGSSDFNNWLLTDLIFRKNWKMAKKVRKVRNVRSQFTVKQSEKRLAIAARWGGRWAFIRLFGAARVRGNISIGHLKAEGVVYFRVAHPEHLLSSPHRDGWTRIKKVYVFTHRLANERFERKTSAACVCMAFSQEGEENDSRDHGIIIFSSDFTPRTHRNTYFRWWHTSDDATYLHISIEWDDNFCFFRDATSVYLPIDLALS